MIKDKPIGAHSVTNITNSASQLIADKLQFFVDAFKLLCLKSGEYYEYEVENHLTIIEHLIFFVNGEINSLDYQKRRAINSFEQIKFILKTHPLFKTDGLIFSETNTIRQKLTKIEELNFSNKESFNELKNNLEELRQIVEPNYLDNLVNSLYTYVNCTHQLNHHKKDLKRSARLIFSHFYHEGHSRNQIHGFINKLLAKKLSRQGDKIYPEAPLPENLYIRLIEHNTSDSSFNEDLWNDIESFLDNRTLKEQIHGFVYLSKYKKYTYTYLFRVDSIMIWPDETELFELKFFEIDHFKNQYSQDKFEHTNGFFENSRQSALIEVSVMDYSHDRSVFTALKTLREKLGIIARRTRGKFSINYTGYTFYPTDGMEFWVNTMPEPWKLSQFDVDGFNYIEKIILNSPHEDLYRQLERVLSDGYNTHNHGIAIHFYRKFMQILKDNTDLLEFKNEKSIPPEISALACMLTSFEKDCFTQETHQWALNVANNLSSPFGNHNGYNELRNLLRKENGFLPLKRLIRELNHEHTKYEAYKALDYRKRINEQESYFYYVRQLLFVKQFRDKNEHASFLDEMIARKLDLHTYQLMNRLLEQSFKKLNSKSNNKKNAGEVLRNIVNGKLNLIQNEN